MRSSYLAAELELAVHAHNEERVRHLFLWNPTLVPAAEMLEFAVSGGHLELARELLTRPRHVNEKFDDNQTLLQLASYRGNAPMVELLLNSGADWRPQTRTDERTALHYAVIRNHLPVVRLLLLREPFMTATQDSRGNVPLHYASSEQAVQLLVQADARTLEIHNRNGMTPLIAVIVKMYEHEQASQHRTDPAFLDLLKRYLGAVIQIMKFGANLRYLQTYDASIPNLLRPYTNALVRLIVSTMAYDPNDTEDVRRRKDDFDVEIVANVLKDVPWLVDARFGDQTLLINALEHEREPVVRALMAHGAHIDLETIVTGNTVVHIAASENYLWFLREFASDEDLARPNRFDENRAIHLVCLTNNVDGLRLLMERGVDTVFENSDGWTPLMYAVRNDNYFMVRALLDYQTQPSLVYAIEIADEFQVSLDIKMLLRSKTIAVAERLSDSVGPNLK